MSSTNWAGPSELRVFDLDGKRLSGPEQLPVSTVGDLTRLEGDDILFGDTSFVAPPAVYRFFAERNRTEKTRLATVSPVDFSDVEVVRKFATSKDGTKIPVNILYPQGTQARRQEPRLRDGLWRLRDQHDADIQFRATRAARTGLCLRHRQHPRGEASTARRWHRQGNLTHKQNVFDDFTAGAPLPDRPGIHVAEPAGDRRGEQRWAVDGGHPDAAPAPDARGRFPRRHLRHAPLRAVAQRRVQYRRVRHGEGPASSSGALRLFALPSREGRRALPGRACS